MRVGAEVGQAGHRGLGAAQPEPVGDLERGRVPEHRQPPLTAPAADPADLLIGMVEKRLQLIYGERPLGGVTLGLLDMDRGVPLMADLHRVGTEPHLALSRPPIRRVGQVNWQNPDTARA